MALATAADLKIPANKALARVVDDDSSATKQLVSPYNVKKPQHSDLVELAREVQRADEEVRHMASGKLQIIAEQIRFLQQQAQGILEEAKDNAKLHHAKCNLVKQPGQIYYLYERQSGVTYFSLLSPQEWKDCPHLFLDAYRLEHDRSWTKLEDMAKKDRELKVIDGLMNRGSLPSLEYMASMPSEKKATIEDHMDG